MFNLVEITLCHQNTLIVLFYSHNIASLFFVNIKIKSIKIEMIPWKVKKNNKDVSSYV